MTLNPAFVSGGKGANYQAASFSSNFLKPVDCNSSRDGERYEPLQSDFGYFELEPDTDNLIQMASCCNLTTAALPAADLQAAGIANYDAYAFHPLKGCYSQKLTIVNPNITENTIVVFGVVSINNQGNFSSFDGNYSPSDLQNAGVAGVAGVAIASQAGLQSTTLLVSNEASGGANPGQQPTAAINLPAVPYSRVGIVDVQIGAANQFNSAQVAEPTTIYNAYSILEMSNPFCYPVGRTGAYGKTAADFNTGPFLKAVGNSAAANTFGPLDGNRPGAGMRSDILINNGAALTRALANPGASIWTQPNVPFVLEKGRGYMVVQCFLPPPQAAHAAGANLTITWTKCGPSKFGYCLFNPFNSATNMPSTLIPLQPIQGTVDTDVANPNPNNQ